MRPSGRPVGRPLTGPPVAVLGPVAFRRLPGIESVARRAERRFLLRSRLELKERRIRAPVVKTRWAVALCQFDLGHGLRALANVTVQRHPATSPSLVVGLLRTGEEVSSTCSVFVSESGRACEDAQPSQISGAAELPQGVSGLPPPPRILSCSRTRLRGLPLRTASHPSTTLNTIARASLPAQERCGDPRHGAPSVAR